MLPRSRLLRHSFRIRLSAYLAANAPKDAAPKYAAAASLAATFMGQQLLNGAGLIINGIDLSTCAESTSLYSFGTGAFIEGLAVLADVTGDPQLMKT
jgi:hypothetical protein